MRGMTDGENFQRVSASTPLHRLSMIIEQTATLLCELPGGYHKIVLLRQHRDEDNGQAQFASATRKRAQFHIRLLTFGGCTGRPKTIMTDVSTVFWDNGGVILTNGWDRGSRKLA